MKQLQLPPRWCNSNCALDASGGDAMNRSERKVTEPRCHSALRPREVRKAAMSLIAIGRNLESARGRNLPGQDRSRGALS